MVGGTCGCARAGAFADPYTAGNLAGGFLFRFRILLDYGRMRIALLDGDPG